MGGYQQYAARLWAVAVVIILVDYISARWRENILKDQPPLDVGETTRPVFSTLRIGFLRDRWNCSLYLLLECREISIRSSVQSGQELWQPHY